MLFKVLLGWNSVDADAGGRNAAPLCEHYMSGIVDLRCDAVLAPIVINASSLNSIDGCIHTAMPVGCREALYKYGNEILVRRDEIGTVKTFELKRLYNRKTRTYNDVSVTLTPLSIKRMTTSMQRAVSHD